MNAKFFKRIIFFSFIGVGGYVVLHHGILANNKKNIERTGGADTAVTSASTAKIYTVVGDMYYFKPDTIRVKKGETVSIRLINRGVSHDWVVDEFSARTRQLADGETDTVTFIADKTGTFEYYSSINEQRTMGMVGKLIVYE